jgi:hypothetical protein
LFNSFVKSTVIRFFDYFTPARGLHRGFEVINILNLDKSFASYFSSLISPRLLKKEYHSLSEKDVYYSCALVIPHVYKLIRSYLGPTASLDSVRLFILYPEDAGNTSGIPHHDSVGHRLKLFVPIRLPGCLSTPTNYVSQSNTIRWSSYSNPVRADQSRVDIFWTSADVLRLNAPANCCYIFDTNGIHWGSYQEIIKPRVNIVFEFSNIKSYFVRGLIGPRMSYSSDLRSLLCNYKLLPFHLRLPSTN